MGKAAQQHGTQQRTTYTYRIVDVVIYNANDDTYIYIYIPCAINLSDQTDQTLCAIIAVKEKE